ncbi:hypothetical protein MPSEU_000635700 [Mayamaea pseudoterrestris]|nr:hypothetical protein MPSEU_000635700 [Mayamaea pseudoterrestris]
MPTSPGRLETVVSGEVEEFVSPVSLESIDRQQQSTTLRHSPPHDLLQPVLDAPRDNNGLLLQRPTAVQTTDREKSWEQQSLPCHDDPSGPIDLFSDAGTHQDLSNRRLDLKTLMSTNPLESEAEAYIQRSLEERDPTMPYASGSEAQKTILGSNLPIDIEPDIFGREYKTTMGRAGTPRAKGHRKVTSTAEDLFQLGMDLTELNQQHGNLRNEDESQGVGLLHAAKPLPANLIQRMTSKRRVVSTNDNEEAHLDKTAADRWNHLKHKAMAVTFSPPRPHLTFSESTKFDENAENSDDEAFEVKGNVSDVDDDEEKTPRNTTSKRPTDFRPSRSLSQRKKSRDAASQFRRAAREKTTMVRIRHYYNDFEDWFQVKKLSFLSYIKILLCIILPATAIASILFYAADNPRVGYGGSNLDTESSTAIGEAADSIVAANEPAHLSQKITAVLRKASWSWWILFIFVRQVLTLALALATQALIIEYTILRSKFFVRIFGSFVTLFVIQSRGWPFVTFTWTVYDFAFMYGGHPWTEHWLWWQNSIDMMNSSNSAGGVTSANEYLTVLVIMITVSSIVMAKRFYLSLFLGKQTYIRYGGDLARLMRKSLLIGQVSGLARDKEDLGFDIGDLKHDLGIDLHEEY